VAWEILTPLLLCAMEYLFTKFIRELDEKIVDIRKLFTYLSESYFGADADLIRIRGVYRELTDLKTFYTSKNASITNPEERSWDKDQQSKEGFQNHIDKQINPFIEMLQFIIEMYEEDRVI
jgi:hypothetical protein